MPGLRHGQNAGRAWLVHNNGGWGWRAHATPPRPGVVRSRHRRHVRLCGDKSGRDGYRGFGGVARLADDDDRFRVTGQLTEGGEPVGAWMEVQDDDIVLHDYLASGQSRSDGTFGFEFRRRAFHQQPWESEALPNLVIYVWRGHDQSRPEPDDPPTHEFRLPRSVFEAQVAELGPLPLDEHPFRGGWLLRQAHTSRRPGRRWTAEEVQPLFDEVRGWVLRVCGPPSPPPVTLTLAPLSDAVGAYVPKEQKIVLDPEFLAKLGADAVRRLLAHEWAHATAHHALGRLSDALEVRPTGPIARWSLELAEEVPMGAGALAACLVRQAATANHEGYAHFVEECVVRRHLPLSAYPAPTLWERARMEAQERQLGEEAFRLWLAQHDALALRHLGLAWYRHHYRRRRGAVQFQRKAGAELLAACMDRFGRLVRGDGQARRAPSTEPWF